jgi:4,5-dihydroxyphthalate decarboxylase
MGLALSIAVGDYDRNRPLLAGEVQIDGVSPIFMTLEPEEIFFRAFRHAAFDICEMSLSSFTMKTALGDAPYVGVPAFLSRAFRHTSIYIRTDRGIRRPQDLKGRRIGVPEYQVTAAVWVRAILADYGVEPSDMVWVRGGLEQAGRPEKIALELPANIRVEDAPAGTTLSEMLAAGAIDGLVTPRAPSCYGGAKNISWLFADPTAEAKAWYQRTRIFPIMHLLGIRRELAEAHPWLPQAALKAFTASKAMAVRKLADTSATKVTLPFVEEQVRSARELMGDDFWSYGMRENHHVLEAFLDHHNRQGLSPRRLAVEELFHPSTHEAFKI